MRELVIRRGGRLGWGVSLQKPQASVDQVPWGPLETFIGPNGIEYPLFGSTLIGEHESLDPSFLGFVQQAFKASPVVFACVLNRMMLFRTVRFQYRRRVNGRPGNPFGDASLQPLEHPWPGANTSNLLAIAELMNSVAGNFLAVRRGDQIKPLRPDWTAAILGSNTDPELDQYDIDAEVIGYAYQPGGAASGKQVEFLFPEDVAHYMPIPDPECPWRGMSWITPVIQELLADKTLTSHKRKYMEKGATPNLGVKINVDDMEKFKAWVRTIKEERESGGGNPYQWLFLGAVADPIPLGSNLEQIDFANVQGAGEVRIAAAAMVHPALAGFSEGLQGSALNAGNLNEAFRQFATVWAEPSWQDFAGAMERILEVPSGAELWADTRDVSALAEDSKKLADIMAQDASTISTLFMAGGDWDAIIEAVTTKDLSVLKGKHVGLPSVQVQKSSNGAGNPDQVAVPE